MHKSISQLTDYAKFLFLLNPSTCSIQWPRIPTARNQHCILADYPLNDLLLQNLTVLLQLPAGTRDSIFLDDETVFSNPPGYTSETQRLQCRKTTTNTNLLNTTTFFFLNMIALIIVIYSKQNCHKTQALHKSLFFSFNKLPSQGR